MNPKIDRELKRIKKLSLDGDLIQAEIAVNSLLSEYPKNLKAKKARTAILARYEAQLPEGLAQVRELSLAKDYKGCLEAATEIASQDPAAYEAVFYIAHAHDCLGEPEKAIENYKRCIEMHPGYYKAHNDMGLLLQRRKNYVEAFSHFAVAVENSPQWNGPLNNLGSLLNVMNQPKEALMALDQAVSVNPKDPRALINRGNTYWQTSNKDKAVRDFMQAIKIAPHMFEPYSNLAEIHERSNDGDSIRQILDLAVANGIGDHPSIQMRWGELLVRENSFEEAVSHLDRVPLDRVSEKHAQVVARLLSRCHDKLGNAAEAFENFQRMNDLNASSFEGMQSDADRYFNRVSGRLEEAKDVKEFSWSNPFVPDEEENLAFLVGFPRSGTTLLDTILSSHTGILTAEEKPMLDRAVKMLGDRNTIEGLDSLTDDEIRSIRTGYLIDLRRSFAGETEGKLLIDKMPLNLSNAAFINRVFPEAKFIFAIRDPGDCTLSCFMQSFQLNDAMANFNTIKRSAEVYDKVMQLWTEYQRILPLQVFANKYEDLIVDLKGCCKPMLEFLELEWSDSLLDYRKEAGQRTKISTPSYSQVVKPLYKDASGRWKKYEAQMVDALPYLTGWRDRFGYD